MQYVLPTAASSGHIETHGWRQLSFLLYYHTTVLFFNSYVQNLCPNHIILFFLILSSLFIIVFYVLSILILIF